MASYLKEGEVVAWLMQDPLSTESSASSDTSVMIITSTEAGVSGNEDCK